MTIMRIISIDPGYERLGIAILEKINNKEKLIFSECFQTSKDLSHPERIFLAVSEIERIIKKYGPKVLTLETLFFAKNAKTALKVAEVRGAILYQALRSELSVCELSPGEIKIAVCGNGTADKKAVIKMVQIILNLPDEKKFDDEFDAIAAGLAYFALERSKRLS
ncbi:MAG: crossover junction endodeoxyribonuclease RuvC [bacterium]